jgi:acyl-homoserine lactone acylase PvdQ
MDSGSASRRRRIASRSSSYLVRAARGRSAEVLGQDALDVDRWSRTLGFARLAQAQLGRVDTDVRRVLEAYAAGVNAWIDEVRSGRAALPVPLARLGVSLEDWTAADSLAIEKIVAWGFDGSVDATLVLSDLIEKLGGFGARPFFPREAARGLAPAPPPSDTEARVPAARDPLRAALALAGRSVGSSAWLVAAHDSESGAPLLAGDLHLAPTAPALLYESHLSAPGFEVAGAGPVGVPVYWSGHNERVAWAATHARAVATDLYVETLDPDHLDRYAEGNGSGKLAVRQEQIDVRDGDSLILPVRETHHGPLLDLLLGPGRPALAAAWGGEQPGDGVAALLHALQARDAAEFRNALASHHEPVFVFVFADTAGHGGRQVAGWLPARSMPTGLVPVPGRSPFYDWRSRIAFEALPYQPLGTDGFLVAADNPLGDETAIEWWWRPGERSARIEALLREMRAKGPIDARAAAAILADQRSAAAPARVRALLDPRRTDRRAAARGARHRAPARRVGRRLRRRERRRRRVASAARRGARIVSRARARSRSGRALSHTARCASRGAPRHRARSRDRAGRRRGRADRLAPHRGARRAAANRAHAARPARLQPRTVALGRTARAALRRVRLARGCLEPRRAGELAVRRRRRHGRRRRVRPTEPFAVRVASIYRWIVDLAAPEVALSALVPGTPEHPADPLHDEGVDRWLAGRPGVLATHRFLVEDGARSRLVLVARVRGNAR